MKREEIIQVIAEDKLMPFIQPDQLAQIVDFVIENYQQPMPNSTQLIELWHEDKEMLKEKDFRGDQWRLAYNAFMCGFGRGIAVKKQEQPKPTCKTCGFYENNCPFIRGKLIPYPNKVCKDYIHLAMKEYEPAEWSEEDERKIVELKTFIAQCNGFNKENRKKAFDMIDAIRHQHLWKPSEGQMKWLKDVIETVPMTCRQQVPLESLYADLQKLL